MNQLKKADPLARLFQDSFAIQEEQREKLASLLEPFVVLGNDRESRTMNFKSPFFQISNIEKLEICFLAEKARGLYFGDLADEGLGQTDLISLKIMPAGSVKSGLSRLANEKRVIPSKKGKYIIPNYRLPELLTKKFGKNHDGK